MMIIINISLVDEIDPFNRFEMAAYIITDLCNFAQ